MSERLILMGLTACGVSGLAGFLFSHRTCTGQWISTAIAVVGCSLGLTGVGVFWATGKGTAIRFPWLVPGGEFYVEMDGLSALFLVPVFLISMLGSLYGLSYWKQTEHPDNGRKLRLFYGLLPTGMALLIIARNSLLFLVGWEVMALSGFFLISTEDHDREARETGWMYLVATHCSTICLVAMFALLGAVSGSLDLKPIPAEMIGLGAMKGICLLGLLGFGLKAGLMPLHIWLPSAHAIAPSHVSAIMSGVIIKMGIYGLLRVSSMLPPISPEWACFVLGLGAVSGVLGVAYAIAQRDLKRLLAYSSIENIGIIVMGIGLALLGRSLGHSSWIILGLASALLHVWNHAFFKALLFFSAGSVIHATHTRQIDKLGGLAKKMPRTSLCFLVGALAVCGLPPLNGFVGEFLLYLGLFRTLGMQEVPSFAGVAMAAPALALIGALALACFVKVFGAVFLGTPRSEHVEHAHESNLEMIGPMLVLVDCCIFIGLAPICVEPALMMAVQAWAPALTTSEVHLTSLAPLTWISGMGLFLTIATILASVLLWSRIRRLPIAAGPTWGCGYAAPTPRMQYTSSSFAQMLVELFAWALRPKIHKPGHLELFPRSRAFESQVPDLVLENGVLPTFRWAAWAFSWGRVFHRGNIQTYLFYLFLTLLGLLLWR